MIRPRSTASLLRALAAANLGAALVLAGGVGPSKAGQTELPVPGTTPGAPPSVPPSEAPAPAPLDIPKEVRGVWVVRTDMTTPASVSRVITHARRNGLNTLFVQCRGRADAYYNGGLEPRAQSLGKASAGFDPLAQAVAEGHAAGLKVHAWVNACYVWSDKHAPASPTHLVNAHKDWLAVERSGARRNIGHHEVFICPGNPQARAHLVSVCADIARRYDLDGLQLDYIRYADQKLCYCGGCLKAFEQSLDGKVDGTKVQAAKGKGRLGVVDAFPNQWRQFRRDVVTSLVQDIRTAVKTERPSLILSAAVIPWGAFPGDFRKTEAYNLVAQDWYSWMRNGIVDAVCPMTYQVGMAGFNSWVKGVRRDNPDFPVWFGIGAWLFGPESAAAKVQAVRSAGATGWVLFSYTAVTRGGANDAYLRTLKAKVIPSQNAARK